MTDPRFVRRYDEGDRVLIDSPGTAWHDHHATIRCVSQYAPIKYWVHIEGRTLSACYAERDLHHAGVIDRLAQIETP